MDSKSTIVQRSRILRKSSTDAERVSWRMLRSRQVTGAKFRRQHSYGPYILDFYCRELGLAIEVDGGQHYDHIGAAKDKARTKYLQSRGLRIIRFTNLEALRETQSVMARIWEEVHSPSP